MPEVEHGPHLLEWLHDVGPVEQGMNGPQPLSWQEINAWQKAKGVLATGEELSILRQLSKEYVSQYHRSANPHEPPPTRPQRNKTGADQLANDVKSALRASAHRNKQPAD